MRGILVLSVCAIAISSAAPAMAKDRTDSALRAEIARIAAIDNHTHDDPATAQRGSGWRPGSPLGSSTYPDVTPLTRDDPQWIGAWKALYGYKYNDLEPRHLAELVAEKRRRMAAAGTSWPVEVLDAAGVQVAFVNAAHLGAGQQSARFRWVPFADPLLAPFSPDKPLLDYPGGPVTLDELLREGGIHALPGSLEEYISGVVEPTLARWASLQVPAVKFLSAYRRGLDFDVVPAHEAALAYELAAAGQTISSADQKELEDYLFAEVCAHAAAHGLVAHSC